MIGIIDYGLGNLRSVAAAVKKVGFEPEITDNPERLEKAEKLILPGVGAFGDGMINLERKKLIPVLDSLVISNEKPILGICLGFELLCKKSYEFGEHEGLGWIDSQVVRFPSRKGTLRVPHVGWNDLIQISPCPLFEGIPVDALFYHVHSYYMVCDDESVIKGKCEYGVKFVSVIQSRNIFGTQFHPEKSQYHGLKMLHNFLTLESVC